MPQEHGKSMIFIAACLYVCYLIKCAKKNHIEKHVHLKKPFTDLKIKIWDYVRLQPLCVFISQDQKKNLAHPNKNNL